MSQKWNRRTVIKFNRTYKVTFDTSKFQIIFDELIEMICKLFDDIKVQTVFSQTFVINKIENKAKRF